MKYYVTTHDQVMWMYCLYKGWCEYSVNNNVEIMFNIIKAIVLFSRYMYVQNFVLLLNLKTLTWKDG